MGSFTAEPERSRAATDQNRFTTEDTEITEKNPLILPSSTIWHTVQGTECESVCTTSIENLTPDMITEPLDEQDVAKIPSLCSLCPLW